MSKHAIRISKMVDDAYWMSLQEYIDTWGLSQARVWTDVRSAADSRYEQNRQKTPI